MHNLVLRQRDAPLGAPLVQEGVMHKCSARGAEGPCSDVGGWPWHDLTTRRIKPCLPQLVTRRITLVSPIGLVLNGIYSHTQPWPRVEREWKGGRYGLRVAAEQENGYHPVPQFHNRP